VDPASGIADLKWPTENHPNDSLHHEQNKISGYAHLRASAEIPVLGAPLMYHGCVKATFEFKYKSKIQFNSFCLQCEYCMYALKRIGKIIQENAFEQKKKTQIKI